MRSQLPSLLLAALVAVAVTARDAHVYVSGSRAARRHDAITPFAARLVIARSLGLAEYHSLDGVDDVTIQALNTVDQASHEILREQEPARSRTFILIEGVDNVEGVLILMNIISRLTIQIFFPADMRSPCHLLSSRMRQVLPTLLH